MRTSMQIGAFAGALAITAVGSIFVVQLGTARGAQSAGADGVISGTVTIDHGLVRAFRVKAKDMSRRITYTVYTNKGQYHIYNLPASRYEVQVMEEGVESPVQPVELTAGRTATANIALKEKGASSEAVGVSGARAQENYGGVRSVGKDTTAKIVDFDTLYPPGPGRDLLVLRCFGCHGPAGWHRRGGHTEAEWGTMVGRMFDNSHIANMNAPVITAGTMTDGEKSTIVKYLTANFGPGSPSRDLRPDPIVRDEEALSKTVFVQYELPPIDEAAASGIPRPRRGTHDVYPSPSMPGVVWMDGFGSGSILRVDTRNPDAATRTKEWYIKDPRNINVGPHAINEFKGHVYWTELSGDNVGDLDIKTGEMHRYPAPSQSGMHTLRVDSKGNVWYTDLAGGKIGRLDAQTKKFTEFEPVKGANFYGVVVDKKDRVWVAGTGKNTLVIWDPKTQEWSKFTPPSNIRRISLDSKDNAWVNSYFGNSVIRVDANTQKMEEYKLPLKYGNPYAVYVDKADNVWLENAIYNSFVKFDPVTKKFTYFPDPDLAAHSPNMEMDAEGTVWFGMGTPSQLTALKLNGNVPAPRKVASR